MTVSRLTIVAVAFSMIATTAVCGPRGRFKGKRAKDRHEAMREAKHTQNFMGDLLERWKEDEGLAVEPYRMSAKRLEIDKEHTDNILRFVDAFNKTDALAKTRVTQRFQYIAQVAARAALARNEDALEGCTEQFGKLFKATLADRNQRYLALQKKILLQVPAEKKIDWPAVYLCSRVVDEMEHLKKDQAAVDKSYAKCLQQKKGFAKAVTFEDQRKCMQRIRLMIRKDILKSKGDTRRSVPEAMKGAGDGKSLGGFPDANDGDVHKAKKLFDEDVSSEKDGNAGENNAEEVAGDTAEKDAPDTEKKPAKKGEVGGW